MYEPPPTCMYCGRNCHCTALPSFNYPLPKTTAQLEWESFDADKQTALRKKWEIRLRFLDSIRPSAQPRTLRPTARTVLVARRFAVRVGFRGVARSRPGYRGTVDGKQSRAPRKKSRG